MRTPCTFRGAPVQAEVRGAGRRGASSTRQILAEAKKIVRLVRVYFCWNTQCLLYKDDSRNPLPSLDIYIYTYTYMYEHTYYGGKFLATRCGYTYIYTIHIYIYICIYVHTYIHMLRISSSSVASQALPRKKRLPTAGCEHALRRLRLRWQDSCTSSLSDYFLGCC